MSAASAAISAVVIDEERKSLEGCESAGSETASN
jgi:hypothetical protein